MACLWEGKDLPSYSANAYQDLRYVRHLAKAAQDVGGKLTLIADNHYHPIVSKAAIPGVDLVRMNGYGCGGWSPILEAFRPDLRPWNDSRHVLVGLDTIVTGDIRWLWEWDDAPIGVPMDPYETDTVCDAVWTFDRLGSAIMWDAFMASMKTGMRAHYYAGRPSEMALVRDVWRTRRWPTLDSSKVASFKAHYCRAAGDLSASIVYFHGRPKPADLDRNHPLRAIWEGSVHA